MSVRMFGMNCDQCPAKSEEYGVLPYCTECGEDVCEACIVPGSHDEESLKAVCKRCAAELSSELVESPESDLEQARRRGR